MKTTGRRETEARATHYTRRGVQTPPERGGSTTDLRMALTTAIDELPLD